MIRSYTNTGIGDAPKWGISGFALKVIAIVSMFIDHTAVIILPEIIESATNTYSKADIKVVGLQFLFLFMRIVGRLAFPIFAFLLVEGFFHTGSRLRYAARLLVFAIISELPFDLAFHDSLFDMSYNNVFFTLFLGLIAIMILDYAIREMIVGDEDAKYDWGPLGIILGLLLVVVSMAGLPIVAQMLVCCDYKAGGVLTILAFYCFRHRKFAASLFSTSILTMLCGMLEVFTVFDSFLIGLYDGTRGRKMKYFFYFFYPMHLLILVAISKI